MTTNQENKRTMLFQVEKYIDDRIATASLFPRFNEHYQELKNARIALQNARIIQEGDKTGSTETKQLIRMELIKFCLTTVRKLVAHADHIKDNTLMAEVDYSESELDKSTNNGLKDIADLLYFHLSAHRQNMSDYAITDTYLADFQALALKYHEFIPTPKQNVNDRSAATLQIKELFIVIENHLISMDRIVAANADTYPEFYKGYMVARRVPQFGKQSLAFQALAKDKEGNPLPNVLFEIITGTIPSPVVGLSLKQASTPAPTPILIKKTGKRGNIKVKSLADGSYSAIVKKLGFQDQELNFHVVGGEMVNLKVEMVAI